MKVEDLHKTKIEQRSNRTVLKLDGYPVDIWHNEGYFDNEQEGIKAAALFRASYQMQEAIKAAIAWFEEGGAKGYPAHKKCVAALELSENTDEKIS